MLYEVTIQTNSGVTRIQEIDKIERSSAIQKAIVDFLIDYPDEIFTVKCEEKQYPPVNENDLQKIRKIIEEKIVFDDLEEVNYELQEKLYKIAVILHFEVEEN